MPTRWPPATTRWSPFGSRSTGSSSAGTRPTQTPAWRPELDLPGRPTPGPRLQQPGHLHRHDLPARSPDRRYLEIHLKRQSAAFLGVAVVILRRWERAGRLVPAWRTPGGHRRYTIDDLSNFTGRAATERRTVGYARVSSHDQKDDLQRQAERLESYGKRHAYPGTVFSARLYGRRSHQNRNAARC
ncbi:MerR family DNA-binding transcriptional regulator [Rhodovibrio salinarum]|uniref:Resolvase, N terminal domain n=1 Tax=Rhodovibrio salinarum TaxID=1087 RepID=A0A934QFW2_9PROT|nr:hypothetical protein [Rhodovibrio salinarum]